MDLALDSIECDRVVCRVRCEDGDGVSWGEGVDGNFVRGGVFDIVWGVAVEGGVQSVVDLGDVFVEMLSCVRRYKLAVNSRVSSSTEVLNEVEGLERTNRGVLGS